MSTLKRERCWRWCWEDLNIYCKNKVIPGVEVGQERDRNWDYLTHQKGQNLTWQCTSSFIRRKEALKRRCPSQNNPENNWADQQVLQVRYKCTTVRSHTEHWDPWHYLWGLQKWVKTTTGLVRGISVLYVVAIHAVDKIPVTGKM